MAKRALSWSPDAIRDLQEIADYIARDKPGAARRWAQTLTTAAEHAATLPFAGQQD
ncbi:type II toxin-antitoxin system RelE/ParE family toxin [Plesiocystis pacifica]|uniref:type II toxin-antitoxin system RelE/ParE family toxin n=1 Tax=Plesiocystis pacifica TaxID=191768 RepID=UPI000A308BC5